MRAEATGDSGPWRQQAVLGRSHWDADALRDLVRTGCGGLGDGDVEVRHRRQAQLGAELAKALMLRSGNGAAPGMPGAANSAS